MTARKAKPAKTSTPEAEAPQGLAAVAEAAAQHAAAVEPAAPAVAAPAAGVLNPRLPIRLDVKALKPVQVVEAILFSAGKPVLIEEMAEQTGLTQDVLKKACKELQEIYDENTQSVLEVGKAGVKWAMQVRSKAAAPAARFAPMEIAPKLLKTLALIAYHQPLKQSELVEMIGSKVYDHIPELVERGLVRAREEGVTKILITTASFPEYFGLDASTPEEIRAYLAKLVGLDPNAPKPTDRPTTAATETTEPATAADAPTEGEGPKAELTATH